MKTNAKPESIIAAVEKVSKERYNGNLILAKNPEGLTKNVTRFTLRTKDKHAEPSIINKDEKPLPRASAEAHNLVVDEIFAIEGRSNVYVQMINDERRFAEAKHVRPEAELAHTFKKKKHARKSMKKTAIAKATKLATNGDQISVSKFIKALKTVLENEMA